ncbi:hypothetical protein FHV95_102214 [Streptomyces coelicolor]|nr:hypothetical protein FHV91_102214 [Streptomyces coelicolor]TYP17632.1 hypothetical protein FHV98_102290 [Streptomyces coelicolor A3(2)]TYP37929.1 hypothetical protein FHV94_102214 [Streptomyces coelicolor]TYP43420.1 hypothetical protein FHV92_102210 [Streptomyces coelicolor]TYP58099.1 hypothetical protein FHV95_102214 [Streptomyces coelicolor]
MRSGLTVKAVTSLALAALCVQGCSAQPAEEKPAPTSSASAAPFLGNRDYVLPDSPFTRDDTVVTATCGMGARYAAVTVRAWDPETWQPRAERTFPIPGDAAFTNYAGAKTVNSPLVDLCGMNPDNPSPYEVATLDYMAPRVRALFDLAFTRMAVVLRDPDNKADSHVGYVVSGAGLDDVVRLDGAAGADEQNAVMSPDGSSVWFTYTAEGGGKRIGSRPAEGSHHLSDEGPAAGHGLPLTVLGKPPRAVQADTVHLAPGGRRLTAKAPKVFGNVFDTWTSSGPLTSRSAHRATLLSGCVGVVGWTGDDRVLCRTSTGTFRIMDARTGRASGAPVSVVGPQDGTVAEGMLVSPDGERFLVAVHEPNARRSDDDYSYRRPDFRVVPTTGSGATTSVVNDLLDTYTMFLSWS